MLYGNAPPVSSVYYIYIVYYTSVISWDGEQMGGSKPLAFIHFRREFG